MEYVTNEQGERTKVLLDLKDYERLLEAAEDAEDAATAQEELDMLRRGETERTLRVAG